MCIKNLKPSESIYSCFGQLLPTFRSSFVQVSSKSVLKWPTYNDFCSGNCMILLSNNFTLQNRLPGYSGAVAHYIADVLKLGEEWSRVQHDSLGCAGLSCMLILRQTNCARQCTMAMTRGSNTGPTSSCDIRAVRDFDLRSCSLKRLLIYF